MFKDVSEAFLEIPFFGDPALIREANDLYLNFSLLELRCHKKIERLIFRGLFLTGLLLVGDWIYRWEGLLTSWYQHRNQKTNHNLVDKHATSDPRLDWICSQAERKVPWLFQGAWRNRNGHRPYLWAQQGHLSRSHDCQSFLSFSCRSNAGRFAGHDQDTYRRPTRRHWEKDSGSLLPIRRAENRYNHGCFACKLGSSQLRCSQTCKKSWPVWGKNYWSTYENRSDG